MDYMNESIYEQIIQGYENQLLIIMKTRYEEYPTERNDYEWEELTNFVCRRRCQRQHSKDQERK
jgi:hypothetical protein